MENVLIMHTGGWIGDMILLTPALRNLKNKFPNSKMTMLLLPLVSELMSRNPYLDEIITYDKNRTQKGFLQMCKMADKLKKRHFDTAIILHPNSVKSAVLAYMAKIPDRIGTQLLGNRFFLTTRIKPRRKIHEVERYLDIVSSITGTASDKKLEFWGIEQIDENFADEVLKNKCKSDLIIGVNVSTTWQTKMWKPERFAELAEQLNNQYGANVILTGGYSDVQLGEKITKFLSKKYIINLIGKTTLWQLGAIIKRCAIYITCDSGPMHISAGLGTRTVALFGPTDPVRHRPYGDGHIVIKKDIKCSPCYKRECKYKSYACMEAIQIDDVIEAIKSIL